MLTVNPVPCQGATAKPAKQKRCTAVLSQDGWVSRMPPVRPPMSHAHRSTTPRHPTTRNSYYATGQQQPCRSRIFARHYCSTLHAHRSTTRRHPATRNSYYATGQQHSCGSRICARHYCSTASKPPSSEVRPLRPAETSYITCPPTTARSSQLQQE